MKTESHSISDVLAKNATSFFIPPFQRAYAWGKPEIERFFSDLIRIIDSELDNNQHNKLEHFFGTIVLREETDGFANKSIIVDGQQRLTTTLIFLIALRDLEQNEEKKRFITKNYLKNENSTYQDKIKLKQVTKDWEVYRALVNNTAPKPGPIYNVYQLFKKLINEKKISNPDIQFEQYIKALQRMNVAVIFLDERPYKGEDPQIIFETLNSLGKPLTLSDLIRNYILLNMDSDDQTNIYEQTWHPKIELILNEYTSKFFRDYLQLKKSSTIKVVSDNNTKEIYSLFKDFVESNFGPRNNFIDDIVRYVNWYKWIITEVVTDIITPNPLKDKEIKELLRNIFHDIKSEAFKPFVLGLLEYHQSGVNEIKINDDMLISILETIRTYLIRRRILGLTKAENKNIVLLSNRIGELAKGNITMLELLSNLFYDLRFPNDTEIRRVLETMNFYEGLKNYSKFILGKIEEHNTKVAVDFRNSKITIEHIMPQKLDDSWKTELGVNFGNIHKTLLHNIGNLILTEFNSEIGNKSFTDKKEKLAKSSLYYRLDIINKNKWDESNIIEHRNKMIQWFLETFPLPDVYQENDNWNTKKLERTTFSPLDDDASDIGEYNKPIELHIENTIIKVNIWHDVFLEFLKYIKNSPDYDFEFLVNNQSEIFHKDDVIIKWETLSTRLQNNIDLINRYKTLDGKVSNKVGNITDDLLFIHINFSASTCISRIANIMNKFNMPENSVEIVLK